MSFVKSAPEIAEEILLKTAGLPDSLRSFPRTLFEKEAVDTREKLQLPTRMTLSDLQKLAHETKTDLPRIAGVQSDEYTDVASQLRKIAAHAEEEEAREIFETGAALAASKTAAAAILKFPAKDIPTVGTKIKAFFGSPAAKEKTIKFEQHLSGLKAESAGTREYSAVTEREHAKGMRELVEKAQKEHSKRIGEGIKAIPGAAGAAAVGIAGAAALKPQEKKTIQAERAQVS